MALPSCCSNRYRSDHVLISYANLRTKTGPAKAVLVAPQGTKKEVCFQQHVFVLLGSSTELSM